MIVRAPRWKGTQLRGLGRLRAFDFSTYNVPDPSTNNALSLNCPGDPGCPGYVAPGSSDYLQSLQNELALVYSSLPIASAPVTNAGGLNLSSNMVLGIGAGLLVLVLISGRRH